MPPTDPAEAFDDFILSHIFSFLPAREIIRTGYNVSPSWWRFYKRSRICRKLYLALENVDPAEKARVMYLPPGDVDWRMPCKYASLFAGRADGRKATSISDTRRRGRLASARCARRRSIHHLLPGHVVR